LTASLHWRRLRERQDATVGGRISMTKSMLLLIGLFFAVPLGVAGAQTVNQGNRAVPGNQGLIGTPNQAVPGNQGLIGTPNRQSISPARSPCGAGSQSVRVCNDDFQSCNSACTAATISDTSADITGCTQGCCTKFSACLSIRGCANLTALNCFSDTSPSVRALRGGVAQ
jgi:hypothetical protein